MATDDGLIHFCDDDGAEIEPDLIAKPDLCVTCTRMTTRRRGCSVP